MKTVTDQTLADTISKSSKLLIVDCHAEWCMPCKRLKPVLETLAKDRSTAVDIVSLDIDDNSQSALKYQIRSVPTLLFFKGGKLVDTVVGLQKKSSLEEAVDRLSSTEKKPL